MQFQNYDVNQLSTEFYHNVLKPIIQKSILEVYLLKVLVLELRERVELTDLGLGFTLDPRLEGEEGDAHEAFDTKEVARGPF
jgi:hypothetical protein